MIQLSAGYQFPTKLVGYDFPTKINFQSSITNNQYKKINGYHYKCYNANNEHWPNENQCLFYTGGSSSIPAELYNSFLTKLSSKDVTVNVVNVDIKKNHILLKALTHNKPTTIVAHSSGATEALDACNYLDNIKNVVLMDPVDARIFSNENEKEKIKPKYDLERVLFLNAQKSYEWRVFPFKIPFIPLFSLPAEKVDVIYRDIISAKKFGHADVLDYPWGKLMHHTLSEGLEDRDELKIEEYHEWLADIVSNYIINGNITAGSNIEYSTK
tara:strand:- start:45 stop:854 length:810 start_codon:yes stop_codon:yes gene_type:complete